MDGSAKVEVSPTWSISLQTILRRMRRIILPDRVMGSVGATMIKSGEANLPIDANVLFELSDKLRCFFLSVYQHDKSRNRLSFDIVRFANHTGLRHIGMRHQCGFHFRRADTMAGYVEYVIVCKKNPNMA